MKNPRAGMLQWINLVLHNAEVIDDGMYERMKKVLSASVDRRNEQ